MPLEDLPHVDEHAVDVAAPEQAAWDAVLTTMRAVLGRTAAARAAALLGCEPRTTTGWERPGAGSTVPGFRVVTAEAPRLVVVAGRHRFSSYGIVVRIEPAAAGCRVRAETRAVFPGAHGALYRLAVVGSGGHAVATRRAAPPDRPAGRGAAAVTASVREDASGRRTHDRYADG